MALWFDRHHAGRLALCSCVYTQNRGKIAYFSRLPGLLLIYTVCSRDRLLRRSQIAAGVAGAVVLGDVSKRQARKN